MTTPLQLMAAILACVLCVPVASAAGPGSCNQEIYDQLYRSIILSSVQKEMTPDEFEKRNESIRKLRDLCRGQKSSYEKTYPWDVVGL